MDVVVCISCERVEISDTDGACLREGRNGEQVGRRLRNKRSWCSAKKFWPAWKDPHVGTIFVQGPGCPVPANWKTKFDEEEQQYNNEEIERRD